MLITCFRFFFYINPPLRKRIACYCLSSSKIAQRLLICRIKQNWRPVARGQLFLFNDCKKKIFFLIQSHLYTISIAYNMVGEK